MHVKEGTMVLVGGKHAVVHHYEDIVGMTLPVVGVEPPRLISPFMTVIVKAHYGLTWYINEEDAIPVDITNQQASELLEDRYT